MESKWNQNVLDRVKFIYVVGKMPRELSLMYEKLPKKADATLNMQIQNKECYTFLNILNSDAEYAKTYDSLFCKAELPCTHTESIIDPHIDNMKKLEEKLEKLMDGLQKLIKLLKNISRK